MINESLIVLVRGIIGFFTLLIFTRLLGKQQVSQLSLFEYILGITIGSSAADLTTDLESSSWAHWVGLLVWILLGFVMQYITLKSKFMMKYLNGEPQLLIVKGKIMEETMKKMRYSIFDLLEQLRDKDVFNIDEVEYAIIEINGNLSVLKKSKYQNLTPNDMNISVSNAKLNTELIYSGILIKYNLEKINRSQKWLENKLRKKGVKDIKSVYLASLDADDNLYVDLFEDKISNKDKSIT
jgi:uncharacterized membrane protein YcaP (DUF421 family)